MSGWLTHANPSSAVGKNGDDPPWLGHLDPRSKLVRKTIENLGKNKKLYTVMSLG
jgi:hypothetical protein